MLVSGGGGQAARQQHPGARRSLFEGAAGRAAAEAAGPQAGQGAAAAAVAMGGRGRAVSDGGSSLASLVHLGNGELWVLQFFSWHKRLQALRREQPTGRVLKQAFVGVIGRWLERSRR